MSSLHKGDTVEMFLFHLLYDAGQNRLNAELGQLEEHTTFLGRQRSPHDVLTHIVLLLQVEQLADFGRTLRPKTSWNSHISEAGDFLFTCMVHTHPHLASQAEYLAANTDTIVLYGHSAVSCAKWLN